MKCGDVGEVKWGSRSLTYGALLCYVSIEIMQNIQSFSVLLCIDRQEGLNIAFTLPISVGIRQVKQNNRSTPFFSFFPSSKAKP
jgi:hypothetical protein